MTFRTVVLLLVSVTLLNACSLSRWTWSEDDTPVPAAPPLPRWAQAQASLVPRAVDQGYPLQSAADGVLIPTEPEQVNLPPQPLSDARLRAMGVRLVRRASYVLRARVLRTESYWFDEGAALVPEDVVMGWQAMSSTAVLRRLSIMQAQRFYMFNVNDGGPFPEPVRLLNRESSNNHLIPSTPTILKQIRDLQPGQLVEIRGFLVDAYDDHHKEPWASSLSRNDTGDGACELIYVTRITWLQRNPIPRPGRSVEDDRS